MKGNLSRAPSSNLSASPTAPDGGDAGGQVSRSAESLHGASAAVRRAKQEVRFT